ncbi:hypothetical protein BGZ79_001947, partial [Entomortierella chlamydospora]
PTGSISTTEQSIPEGGAGHVSIAELDFIGAPDSSAVSSSYLCELEEYVAGKYARVLLLDFWKQSLNNDPTSMSFDNQSMLYKLNKR